MSTGRALVSGRLAARVSLAAVIIAALACAAPAAAQTRSFGLPVVKIDTKDGAPVADNANYVNMTFALTDSANPGNDITIVNNENGIRGRGNTTWSYPKKPYRIKFDKKQSLFGLPAAKSWVLLAEYLDPTLILNMTAFRLGNVLGLPYNHTYRHVQFYLNGEYKGVYGLTEQNQAGEGRVDIDENDGWFVEMSTEYDENPKFRTANYNLPVMIKSPDASTFASDTAYDFVRNGINELCDSIASVNFPENGYRDLIDMDVFTGFLLANDVVKNDELGHPKSTYLYKDNGGKISMGPLWDFDWAFGHTIGSDTTPVHFQYYTERSGRHIFFERFFEDPVFLAKYKALWNEKYPEILAVSEFINDIGAELEDAAAENSKIWHTSGNYAQQIADMKDWWDNRCFWLNGEFNTVDALPQYKIFTTQVLGYSEAASQTFTFVSYGDMTDLSAELQNAGSSDFEISAELSKTPSGDGGFLASISVKPKNSLPAAVYADVLILSGSNQGNPFSLQVPMLFAVKLATPAEVVFPVFSEPIIYTPARKLSEIALKGSGNGVFVWENGDIVLTAGDGAYNVIFLPNDTEKYDSSKILLNKLVDLTIEKANPSYQPPVGLAAVYGDALSSVKLPTGWYWEGTGTVGNAGAQTHKARFIPTDLNNYNVMEGIGVKVTIAKANPVYTIPAGLAAVYGDALSSVELPTGWSWEETGTVGDAGTQTHKAKFTPADIANYNPGPEADVTITVAKAVPNVAAWPVSTAVTYGAALSTSALTGGAASVEGAFAWTNGAAVPTVTNSGYGVTFTPADTANYKTATHTAAIIVAKADPVVIWPANLEAEIGETLSNVLITGGTGDGAFVWAEPAGFVSRADGEYKYDMAFTPADSANYNALTESVTVNVLTAKLIAGPNPAAKQSGVMNFYRQGKQIAGCELRIYDVLGNHVNTVKINDDAANGLLRRKVGSWDLKHANGRLIPKGTYLARGVINTADGKSDKVSLILGVR